MSSPLASWASSMPASAVLSDRLRKVAAAALAGAPFGDAWHKTDVGAVGNIEVLGAGGGQTVDDVLQVAHGFADGLGRAVGEASR